MVTKSVFLYEYSVFRMLRYVRKTRARFITLFIVYSEYVTFVYHPYGEKIKVIMLIVIFFSYSYKHSSMNGLFNIILRNFRKFFVIFVTNRSKV